MMYYNDFMIIIVYVDDSYGYWGSEEACLNNKLVPLVYTRGMTDFAGQNTW